MEIKQFKTESKRILDLMINSIYTHPEIFLRELISNASDAIDKLCYLSLTDDSVQLGRDDFRIKLGYSERSRIITVSDNGIGMTAEEMENNLGVIAKSGTLNFKNTLDKDSDISEVDVIGQFGVGFYSSFMVADKVTVISRAYGSDQAHKWESEGVEGYTLEPCDKEGVGTDIILHIKEDVEEGEYTRFLNEISIGQLVKRYSDYIRWPIVMDNMCAVQKETGEVDDQGNPIMKTVYEMREEVINSMVPIWQRNKSEVSTEEINEFYKNLAYDFEPPISTIRVNAEGLTSYQAMLFIPGRLPTNFFSTEYEPGLQLYCNGVMIMDKCSDVVPSCFRFVRGVVDSPDFSLNISREMLQQSRQLTLICNNLEKKIKAELLRLMRDDREKYLQFFSCFGTQLKYDSMARQGEKRDLIKDLLMFYSNKEKELIPLSKYKENMVEGQKYIYYVCADNIVRAEHLPQTELIQDKGYEILYMTEDIDDFVIRRMEQYDGVQFCNITVDDLGIDTAEDKTDAEKKQEEHKDLLDFVKEVLGEQVVDVKISSKLKSHPVYLTVDGDISIEMEKYFSSMKNDMSQQVKARRVLELNSSHNAFNALLTAFSQDKLRAEKLAKILLAQGKLISGLPLEDAAEYTELICELF